MAGLAIKNAVELGVEPVGSTFTLIKDAYQPWRLFVIHPNTPGMAHPAFLTDHGFIGFTSREAFNTLNTAQWALQTAIIARRTGGGK